MLKLAWRNIWRNKRRTFLTMGMVIFAVFISASYRSLLWGMYNMMINHAAGTYYGHGQIHKEGYWKDKSIENIFPFTDSLRTAALQAEGVKNVFPRIESFALASSGAISRHVIVLGIDSEGEHSLSKFNDRITQGNKLNPADKAVLLGEQLAKRLQLEVGDTLILLSQGYHAISAAGKYPVKGLVNFGNPKINRQILFMPIAEAQWFYGTGERVTSAIIVPEVPEDRQEVVEAVRARLSKQYEVMTWEEMDREMIQAIQADSASGMILLVILYMVISFGLFSTVLMMTHERRNEYGMLVAMGMRKSKIALMQFYEILLMALLGVLLGGIAAAPVVAYFHTHPIRIGGDLGEGLERMGFEPIMTTAVEPSIFINQAIVVFIITIIISGYAFNYIRKIHPVTAMRR